MVEYNIYKPTDRETDFVGNLLNTQPNDLSYIFFSDNNINNINNLLIEEIKKLTLSKYGKGIIIEPQQKNILVTIMRHIYFKNVKNQTDIMTEVTNLNSIVLYQIIPTVMSGLIAQIRYINDYNQLRPLDLPISSNTRKGNTMPYNNLF